jgi:hypothetical protein
MGRRLRGAKGSLMILDMPLLLHKHPAQILKTEQIDPLGWFIKARSIPGGIVNACPTTFHLLTETTDR